MNPSRLFILRPVATSLLMLAILLAGIVAYRTLPISALPEVDYPTIQVTTLYPGASPDVMTSSVTAPLERQFGQMPGLNQMSSVSSAGASVITLQFSLSLALDVAEQEVQAAINAAANLLPTDLPGWLDALRDQAKRVGAMAAWRAHAGHGLTAVTLAGDEESLPGLVASLRAAAVARQGSLVVTAAPPGVLGTIDPWGPSPALALMRRVKEQFDPAGVLPYPWARG